MTNDTTTINNTYNSNKYFIEQEFLHIKNRDDWSEIKIVVNRILKNIDEHHTNDEGVELLLEYIEMKNEKTYINDISDEVENTLLDWITNTRDKNIMELENEKI